MPKSPEQFERLPAKESEKEEEKLKPEKPEEIELTPEQDKELLGLIKKAREAEKQGDNEEAIILLQDIKERLSKIKEGKDKEKEKEEERNYENYGCLKTLEGHEDIVYSVIESKDGKHIISGSNDETIKIWGEKKEKS